MARPRREQQGDGPETGAWGRARHSCGRAWGAGRARSDAPCQSDKMRIAARAGCRLDRLWRHGQAGLCASLRREMAENMQTRRVPDALRRGLPALVGAALCLGALAVWWPALRNGFINYDDGGYVVQNVHVHWGLNWE